TLETYGYDGLSRLTFATDDNGGASGTATEVTERIYDSLSRLLEERQNGAVVSTVYSGDGHALALIYPGGRRLDYVLDAIDRIEAIFEGSTPIAAWDWIGPGERPLRRAHANGTALTFLSDAGSQDIGYDAVRRVARLRHVAPSGAAFVDREHGYDRADNRTFERRLDHQGQTDRYLYDSIYRVTRTLYDQDGEPSAPRRDLAAAAYVLDGVGNRREVDRTDVSAGTFRESYTVNAVNEYTSVGGVARTHDLNGNVTDSGPFAFTYDYANRPVRVVDKLTGAPVAEYRYDTASRRTQKTVYDPATGQVVRTTRFVYDVWRCIEETDAGGLTEATYVYGVELDEHVQIQNGAGTFYLHQNARGDVVALTDSSGAVVEKTLFDDFGRADRDSAVSNPHLFQGARFDPETGLYYFRNRYYDPGEGRFLQRDPVWDPENVGNPYTFAASAPTTRSDPLGEFGLPAVFAPATQQDPNAGEFTLGVITGTVTGLVDMAVQYHSQSPIDQLRSLAPQSAYQQVQDLLAIKDQIEAGSRRAGCLYDVDPGASGEALGESAGAHGAALIGGVLLGGKGSGGPKPAIRPGPRPAPPVRAAPKPPSSVSPATPAPRPSKWCFTAGTLILTPQGLRPIEEVEVGQRVTADEHEAEWPTAVDPEQWVLLRLSLPNPDETDDTLRITALRPRAWLESWASEDGSRLWIEIPELGVYGDARIDSVGPCPPIEAGPGAVVLSTVEHSNGYVLELRFAGVPESVEPTGRHLLFSEARGEWVRADDLRLGEEVRTADGPRALV
ncbi:MAG: hypothetical protein L0206_14950, partial [Actinobacteria bacterium]|nr:hypothetical protein [Actinomycetota bacterium]